MTKMILLRRGRINKRKYYFLVKYLSKTKDEGINLHLKHKFYGGGGEIRTPAPGLPRLTI